MIQDTRYKIQDTILLVQRSSLHAYIVDVVQNCKIFIHYISTNRTYLIASMNWPPEEGNPCRAGDLKSKLININFKYPYIIY